MSHSHVIVNEAPLSDEEVASLERLYGARIQDGAYWYDGISGAWGVEGGPTSGFIEAGLHLGGPLHAGASNGDTDVFVNGRELHPHEVAALQRLLPVFPGHYWIDPQGNFGYEGKSAVANLLGLARGSRTAWAIASMSGEDKGFLLSTDGKNFWSS